MHYYLLMVGLIIYRMSGNEGERIGPFSPLVSRKWAMNQKLTQGPNLSQLIEMARAVPVSTADREEQRRSFAFGNTAFENQDITRAMIDRAADDRRTNEG